MAASLAMAFKDTKTRFCVVSFTSDWLYPTSESRAIVHALNAGGASVSFVEIESDKGHDAFLLHEPMFIATTRGFLDSAANARGLAPDGTSTMNFTPAADAPERPKRSRSTNRVSISPSSPRWSRPGARVLDVGCGDGALLQLLAQKKGVDGRGVELSQRGVNECVAKGLSVIQGDADTDLSDYPDDGFDYVILSQTLQATRRPRAALANMLRIGRRAIISFPNFGYWRVRAQLAFGGRMPVTGRLDYHWHDTPNIHLCTIRDFVEIVDELGAHNRARRRL